MRLALPASAVKLTAYKESRRKLNSGGLEWESGSSFCLNFLLSSGKNSQKNKQIKNSVIFETMNDFFHCANLNLRYFNKVITKILQNL